ncbi:peptidase MA family metallohydrolase [Chloroflexota bacterium]
MIKKTGIFALVFCFFLSVVSPGLVQAQAGLTVLDSSAEAEFPAKLHFNLSAESDADITDIHLHYILDRESYAQVSSEVYIEFVPDTTADVQWAWDMRRTGGLPPGSSVEYWWTVKDVSGNRVETTPATVHFDDNRYPWRELTEGEVTIYWYEGKQAFVDEIMSATQQALARLAEDTGAHLLKPVKIYVYADARDLQGAMIFPQEWTGGVAFTRYGVIAIGISENSLSWGKRAIAHELTHLVSQQMTFNPYSELPTWLNEGLSMYAEGELEPGYATYLARAIAANNPISVRSLSSPFSAYAGESYLSYAESYSLVEFLISNYGQDKMFELLNTFSEGSSYDGALVKVYGFDMDGLDALWRDYAAERYQQAEMTLTVVSPAQPSEEKGMPPALAGVLAALATALILGLSLLAERWAWGRGW